MAKVISFANQKGGVGKSTLCIQQAFYLALQKKKKVLVLDMDGQGNTSSRLAPRRELEDGDYEPILTGTKTQSCSLTSWTALRSCTALAVQTSFIRRKTTRICLRWRLCLLTRP